MLSLHIITFPQGYVGGEAALKNEAGGDEKHRFFLLGLVGVKKWKK